MEAKNLENTEEKGFPGRARGMNQEKEGVTIWFGPDFAFRESRRDQIRFFTIFPIQNAQII